MVNIKSVILRADGGFEKGMGHLTRINVLYKALNRKGIATKVLTVKNELSLDYFKGNNDIIFIEQDDERNLQKWPVAYLYIVDLYEFDIEFYCQLKTICSKVIIFDDELNQIPPSVNGVINHNIYAFNDLYQGDFHKFCGPQYFLLRDEIRNYNNIGGFNRENILVCFGGSDPERQTIRFVNAIRKVSDRVIDVVTGCFDSEIMDLYNIHGNIRVHVNPPDLANIICSSKFAFTGAGTMAYELVFLQIPMFLVVLAENQVRVAKAFEENRLAINLGWFNTLKDENISDEVIKVNNSCNYLNAHILPSVKLIDGQGPERLVDKIVSYYHENLQ